MDQPEFDRPRVRQMLAAIRHARQHLDHHVDLDPQRRDRLGQRLVLDRRRAEIGAFQQGRQDAVVRALQPVEQASGGGPDMGSHSIGRVSASEKVGRSAAAPAPRSGRMARAAWAGPSEPMSFIDLLLVP